MNLVILSNRLPVVLQTDGGQYRVREGAGGLVTALRPYLAEQGGTWVGFCGMYDADRGRGWEQALADHGEGTIRYRPVTPRRDAYRGYYLQYSNQELWPRLHEMTSKMSGAACGYWNDYVEVNRLFADEAHRASRPDSLIWVHDYHLMLAPRMLRERLPEARIGHFLHIPFAPPELMRSQPHVAELLDGVLGADLVGFHIPRYLHHFLDAVREVLGCRVVDEQEASAEVEHQGRRVRLGAFPIGIDPAPFRRAADTKSVEERLAGAAETLILSMDRLDYTKAIAPRLEAYGRLLDEHPQYRERVTLVQLLDISRKDIPAYQQERDQVDRVVERIRERHGQWSSLVYSDERWKRREVAGVMRLSRLCLVTPRCDGMNLVSKEYVAAAPDDGVLVLSRQAGASWQFGQHAVMVDGQSPASIFEGLLRALEMPEPQRRARMAALKENVAREDVFWWAGRFLDQLSRPEAAAPSGDRPPTAPKPAMGHLDEIRRQLRDRQLALLLDYDGTLTPIVRRPEDAKLTDAARQLLSELAQRHQVAIVSGRDRADVEQMVGVPSLTYAGSHGYDIRGPEIRMEHEDARRALPALDQAERAFAERLVGVPGARVERKRFAIAVHYREVAEEHVERVEQAVDAVRAEQPGLRKMGGKKIFELQPDVPWNKGEAVRWITRRLGLDHPGVLLTYLGDDVTDEDAFRVLAELGDGIGIRVGQPDSASHARFYLDDCDQVQQFLAALR